MDTKLSGIERELEEQANRIQTPSATEEEEKRWEVRGTRRRIRRAVCRGERAVVVGEDGIVEVFSSGKVVGHCMKLKSEEICDMFCSDEYIGLGLYNCVLCCKWFSDRVVWLYCLYVEGQTWRKADISDVPSKINNYSYKLAQDTVCCLYGNQISGWSLRKGRTVFTIKVKGAEDLLMTPDLVMVGVSGRSIKVFTLKGSKLYSIQVVKVGFFSPSVSPPLSNTNYTGLQAASLFDPPAMHLWPTSIGQPVTKIEADYSALHPQLPLLCSFVSGKPDELVVRDVSTDSVIWRRPQSGFVVKVLSIDSEFLLIKPCQAPVEILRWSSGEVVATLPGAGDYIRSASPQYIISEECVFYRDLTNR